MVDYIRVGKTVTVAPSKGQTGGSGFGSEGTYESDQAARNAVSSGTTQGAIKGTTKAEKEVSKEWEPGWGGRREDKEVSKEWEPGWGGRREDKEVWQPGYGGRREDTIQQAAQAQMAASKSSILTAAMARNTGVDPYANIKGISREEYLASRRAPDQYTGVRRAAPITSGFYERTAGVSAGLQRGFEGVIGYSETAHPVIKYASGAGQMVTGLPAFFGSGVVGFEAASRMAVTKPLKLPETFAKGLVGFGGELVKTAKTRPIETAGMLTAMIAGPKIIKSVGERLPSVRVRGIEAPSAKGLIDNVAVRNPINQWKPSATNQVWTAGKGWSGAPPESPKIPLTQWKPSTTNPIWTAGKGWSDVAAVAVGAGMTYQGLSVEHGRKAQPIIGITNQPVVNRASFQVLGKTVVAGTPRFKPEAIPDMFKTQFESKTGYEFFGSPTEYAIATKNILPTYDAPTRELFDTTIAKRELTYGMKSTHALGDVPLEDVFERHDLELTTQKNLRAYMQNQKDFVIWGSAANKAQVMGKGGIGYFREIGDVDIHVRNPVQTAQELFDIIGRTEKKGFVTMKGGGLGTAKGTLFDIKDIKGELPKEWEIGKEASKSLSEGKIFLFPEEKVGNIGQFKVQSLSSQATSKLSSVAFRKGTILAHPGRAGKDPFDLAFINEPSLSLDMAKSCNPLRRMAAGRANALDTKIQGLVETKMRTQPVGLEMGQITLEQKNLFFENLGALRAGKTVATLPGREMLYISRSSAYKPMTPGMLAGMVSGGGGISAASMQRTVKRSGISPDVSRQIRTAVKESGYYPTSKTVSGSGLSSLSLTSAPKPRSPVLNNSGSGYQRSTGSPSYNPPRSPPRTPPYNPPPYPRTPPGTPSYPRTQRLKVPKNKMIENFRKSMKATSYGKFPEISRVAGASRVLGMKGLKFPWEEKAKPKPKGKSGRKAKKKR